MSGIYINGMDMPNSCLFCPLNSMKQCRITGGDITWATATQNRRGDCPLVLVPPHGDLIDRDALLDTATIHWSQTTNESCFPIDEIEYAPTIIPASKEGE